VPTSSQRPPSRGNLKYLLLGLAFVGGAALLWVVASKQPPAAPPPRPAADVQRVNPLAKPDFELEEPKTPDAGSAEPEPVAVKRAGRKAGEWECSGDLPSASKVIIDNTAQLRSCYERRLKINNILQGDMRLKVKVGPNGKVVATAVSGSLHDEAVFACVRNLASTWTFQVPSGGTCAVVQVPFQFSPKQP
jgi:outer membrane biosynthesis protein TonB